MTEKKYGRNGLLRIEDTLDRDGECEINIPTSFHSDDATTWIGKDDAVKIIEHLKNVFNI